MAKRFRTSRPRRRSRRNRRRSGQSILLRGTQRISGITGTTNDTFAGFPVIPTFAIGTRLAQIASTFSQFSIVSSTFRYVPKCSTTTAGRIAGTFLFDTRDQPPDSIDDMLQMTRVRVGQLWRQHRFRLPRRSAEKRRYPTISSSALLALSPVEQQEFVPATFIYGSTSPQNGIALGDIVWHYSIRFFNPTLSELDPSGVSSLFQTLRLDHYNDSSSVEDDDEDVDQRSRTLGSSQIN